VSQLSPDDPELRERAVGVRCGREELRRLRREELREWDMLAELGPEEQRQAGAVSRWGREAAGAADNREGAD
jgi:hypothetical protein